MSESFEFNELERFTAGAVGEPGARVFYFQAMQAGYLVTLKCEKQQVGALADYLERLLDNLEDRHLGHLPEDLDLVEPVVPEWICGSIGVGYDEEDDKLVIVVEELVAEDDPNPEPGTARFSLSREQVNAYLNRARAQVAGGRPPCRLCNRPLDPDGWVCRGCPRTNGHGH